MFFVHAIRYRSAITSWRLVSLVESNRSLGKATRWQGRENFFPSERFFWSAFYMILHAVCCATRISRLFKWCRVKLACQSGKLSVRFVRGECFKCWELSKKILKFQNKSYFLHCTRKISMINDLVQYLSIGMTYDASEHYFRLFTRILVDKMLTFARCFEWYTHGFSNFVFFHARKQHRANIFMHSQRFENRMGIFCNICRHFVFQKNCQMKLSIAVHFCQINEYAQNFTRNCY